MTEKSFIESVSVGRGLKLNKDCSIIFACTDASIKLMDEKIEDGDGNLLLVYPTGVNATAKFNMLDDKTQRIIATVEVAETSLHNLAALFEEEE